MSNVLRETWVVAAARECQLIAAYLVPQLSPGRLKMVEECLERVSAPTNQAERNLLLTWFQAGLAGVVVRETEQGGQAANETNSLPPANSARPLSISPDPRRLFLKALDQILEKQMRRTGVVERAQEAIRARLAENITLARLGKELGVSPRTLSRQFDRTTGGSVAQYRSSVRRERALYLLSHTEEKIATIAGIVGFHSPKDLYGLVRKATGLTPGEYRRRSRSDPQVS